MVYNIEEVSLQILQAQKLYNFYLKIFFSSSASL
jgi:hypothetical protein